MKPIQLRISLHVTGTAPDSETNKPLRGDVCFSNPTTPSPSTFDQVTITIETLLIGTSPLETLLPQWSSATIDRFLHMSSIVDARNGEIVQQQSILLEMEHAHPLPEEPSNQSRQPSYMACPRTPLSYGTLSPSTSPGSVSQQTRMLQLRNANLRATAISAQQISSSSGTPSALLSRPLARPANDENRPPTAKKRVFQSRDPLSGSVNVLQEIHDSNRCRQISPSAESTVICQENRGDENTIEDLELAYWDHQASHDCSPFSPTARLYRRSRLRKRLMTERTPPSRTSPTPKQERWHKSKNPDFQMAAFEPLKYIEYLESELASLNAKMDAFISPAATQSRSTRLRALVSQSASLRKEVSAWETKFESRVREEVDRRAQIENGMRSRIQALESELEMKDGKLRELEWELSRVRAKIRESEGLEEINLNLEKRIDVLTNLLICSPTKPKICSTVSSPTKTESSKRAPRPKSMLPAIPSSPSAPRSIATVTETELWGSQPFNFASRISKSPGAASPSLDQASELERPQDIVPDQPAFRSRSSSSGVLRSLPSSSTRPKSIRSTTSLGLQSPEVVRACESEVHAKSTNRQRKMRRFPSSKNCPKPLILPSAASTPSLPASAPVFPDFILPLSERPDGSIDPAMNFLLHNDDESLPCTPAAVSGGRSTMWAQDRMLKGLDEAVEHVPGIYQSFAEYSPRVYSEVSSNDSNGSFSERHKASLSQPLSLDKELETAGFRSPSRSTDLTCSEGGYMTKQLTGSVSMNPAHCRSPSPMICLRQRVYSNRSEAVGEARRLLDFPCITCPPSWSASIGKSIVDGLFANLANLITRVEQPLLIIARKLLWRARALRPFNLAGVEWWFLGPAMRVSRRHEKTHEDDQTITKEAADDRKLGTFALSAGVGKITTADYQPCRNDPATDCALTNHDPSSPVRMPGFLSADPEPDLGLFPCTTCSTASSRRTVRLWIRFSLAVVLAVGVAIRDGPGTLLPAAPPHPPSPFSCVACVHGAGCETRRRGVRTLAPAAFTDCRMIFDRVGGELGATCASPGP